jgi:RNA polymerase sigma-70 factor (ECF subfamily)
LGSTQFEGKTEGQFFAWLRSILARLTIDALRKFQRRGGGKTQSLYRAQDNSSSGWIPEPESDGTSPSQKCTRQEESCLIRKALDELPEAQRTAVTMTHFDGLEVPEIAQRMDTTLAAVTSLRYRGRKALLEKMGQGTNDGEP